MIKIEDRLALGRVVTAAREKLHFAPGMTPEREKATNNAISKALVRLESQGEFITYEPAADRLVIWSTTSNLVYELGPDGRHGCLAELNGSVCWHRVLKRLLGLYEIEKLKPAPPEAPGEDIKAMPYMQPEDTRGREKIGGVWI